MRVTISCSSSDLINKEYIESSDEVLNFLAKENCELNWGSGSKSIMGLCYKIFSDYNRKIYGYTTPKYKEDIKNIPNACHLIYENTFDLKKYLFI